MFGLKRFRKQLQSTTNFIDALGPGITTGAADDDPSGIATYSQQGAQFGFRLLWLSWFTLPFMIVVQDMCARIGIVTGHGLAANIKQRYPKGVLGFVCLLLFAANTLNIAADMNAMAASVKMLAPTTPFDLILIALALGIVAAQLLLSYARYANVLKVLTLSLFAYVLTAFSVHVDWATDIAQGLIPSFRFANEEMLLICAIFGTTISPYLFFWQTSQEVEEHRYRYGDEHIKTAHHHGDHDQDELRSDLSRARRDIVAGMCFSNLIMFFIIVTCAATLFKSGVTNIQTAEQAASALAPFAGRFAASVFGLGIIGTGLLAVPILAGSSAYAVSELFGWRLGLDNKVKEAKEFYSVIIISIAIAVGACLWRFDPIRMLIYSAVANGIVAPVVLFFVIRISSQLKVFASSKRTTALGWFIVAMMSVVGVAALVSIVA